MPSLISREEALRLGEIEDRAEIEALVERAWRVRLERFGDSTDMCSLVNAKSGGCAEDCGFCSQSRFAEADTPMHAMMTPEQILEHARAADMWPIETQRFRFVCCETRRAPARMVSKSRLERPCPWVTMQNR